MDTKARALRTKLIGITLAMFFTGAIGGLIGMHWDAPFYFGFFCGFTLAGLTGLFVLAAHFTPSS